MRVIGGFFDDFFKEFARYCGSKCIYVESYFVRTCRDSNLEQTSKNWDTIVSSELLLHLQLLNRGVFRQSRRTVSCSHEPSPRDPLETTRASLDQPLSTRTIILPTIVQNNDFPIVETKFPRASIRKVNHNALHFLPRSLKSLFRVIVGR